MKKMIYILIFALSLVVAGCDTMEEYPAKDFVDVSSLQEMIDYSAQTLGVTVSSSGEWTIEEFTYDWVSASVMSGKSGSTVEFDVQKNTIGLRR
jgi:hypothetical protein